MAMAAGNIGMMDYAYFIGRNDEILTLLSNSSSLELRRHYSNFIIFVQGMFGLYNNDQFPQIGSQGEDSVSLLLNKMMINNHVHVVGEGIVGRAAFTDAHVWILQQNIIGDQYPLEVLHEVYHQFSAGMQAVAAIPVLPHGVIQLGSTLTIFYYAPKTSESWNGSKLLSGAEFHVGAHVTKFLRLPMIPTSSDRASTGLGSDKTNRYALLFGTLDGSVDSIAPIDELTFCRLQRKMVDVVPHMGGLNLRSFRKFQSIGKAHRLGPDNLTNCELLCHYEMLPLENQLEIAHQIGTT